MSTRYGRRCVVAAVVCASLAAPALAAPRLFILDGNSANLKFSCDLLGMMPVEGAFTRFVAIISLDPNMPGEARAVVKVDARSLQSADERWADDLKSEDFFDIQRHPEFGFNSFAAVVEGPGLLRVQGQLTLKGVTRPVSLRVRYTLPEDSAAHETTIQASGELDRTDFGMTAYSAFVSDQVDIEVQGKPLAAFSLPTQ